MIDAALKTVHVLSLIVWMGGRVFAHFLVLLVTPMRWTT